MCLSIIIHVSTCSSIFYYFYQPFVFVYVERNHYVDAHDVTEVGELCYLENPFLITLITKTNMGS